MQVTVEALTGRAVFDGRQHLAPAPAVKEKRSGVGDPHRPTRCTADQGPLADIVQR